MGRPERVAGRAYTCAPTDPPGLGKWSLALATPWRSGVVEPAPVLQPGASGSCAPCLSWMRSERGFLKLISSRQSWKNQGMRSQRRELKGPPMGKEMVPPRAGGPSPVEG